MKSSSQVDLSSYLVFWECVQRSFGCWSHLQVHRNQKHSPPELRVRIPFQDWKFSLEEIPQPKALSSLNSPLHNPRRNLVLHESKCTINTFDRPPLVLRGSALKLDRVGRIRELNRTQGLNLQNSLLTVQRNESVKMWGFGSENRGHSVTSLEISTKGK